MVRAIGEFERGRSVALQREVIAAWRLFIQDGTLIPQLGSTSASARK
jgi:hypothetical protein